MHHRAVALSVALAAALVVHPDARAADTTTADLSEFGCTANYNACIDDYRIDVGSARIIYDLSRSASDWVKGDAYHSGTSGECGWSYLAATIPLGEDLLFVLGSTTYTDLEPSYGQIIRKRLRVTEYSGINCTGTALRTYTDQQDITTPTGTDNQLCLADYKQDCSGGYGDPTFTCRLPDVLFNRPSGGGVRWYQTRAMAGLGLCGAYGCLHEHEDVGCVEVNWN